MSNPKVFPHQTISDEQSKGMDLRDYFAIHAPEYEGKITWDDIKESLGLTDMDVRSYTPEMTLLYKAKKRYEYADAMMRARAML